MKTDLHMPDPAGLTATVFKELEEKAALPTGGKVILGLLAGAYIGLGGLFATVALAQGDLLPFGVAQVLAGAVFSLGLVLVLVAGAELFTGNTLMAGPVVQGRLRLGQAAAALAVVYAGNFAGALALALLVMLAGVAGGGEGAVGQAALDLAVTKLEKSFPATFASGVLANMLVCLAVWMSYAGKTVTAKLAALVFPITAFVAAGLEHSVANMYLLPFAYLIQDAGEITLAALIGNLLAATSGNLCGGALIALAYGSVYGEDAQG